MKKIILIAIFLSSLGYAQEKISMQIMQDAKLGIVGDKEHGYKRGTIDVAVAMVLQGKQKKYGYLIAYPEFEYADLKYDSYKRWTANVGYSFNKLYVKNTEVGGSLSYGFIDRRAIKMCIGANGFLKYKLCNYFKLVANMQFSQRPDLDVLYGIPNEYRYSGQIGIEINI
jgi:hypothetical protein